MAANPGKLSIAQLEALISKSKSKLSTLYKKRDQLKKQLIALEGEISEAEGSAGMAPRGGAAAPVGRRYAPTPQPGTKVQRAQNDKSLKTYVEEALAANKKGLTILEIMAAVLNNGYTTNSSNFKNTLYQCLYHNEKTFVLDKSTKCYKLVGK